jgi:hypothetical protein
MRLHKSLVVLALVVSIGGHWAVLQSVAWVGMAVTYSKDASLSQALDKTFDGHHLCKLCKIVQAGKKAEGAHETKFELKKFDLIVSTSNFFLFESPADIAHESFSFSSTRDEAPLLPPPLPA